MNKLFLLLFLIAANLSFAADPSDHQSKSIFKFFIKLRRNREVQTGLSGQWDAKDSFACNILQISWPKEKGVLLWETNGVPAYEKNGEKKFALNMTIKDFVDNVTVPYPNNKNTEQFSFPCALPDSFINEMIKNYNQEIPTIRETNKAILHFFLRNTEEELKNSGLLTTEKPNEVNNIKSSFFKKYFNHLLYGVPIGLFSVITFWWLTKSV